MNLRWVVLFATVAEEGSFTRAASRLNTGQPWISAQIRKLEWELGVKLLTRLNAGVELTPEGRELLPYAQQIERTSQKFRELARAMSDAQSQIVRIGSTAPMFDIPVLRHINNDFMRQYKQFSLRADSGTTEGLMDDLRSGQIDFLATILPLQDAETDFLSISLNPICPYILAPRSMASGPDSERFLGRTIAVPPPELQPAIFSKILAPLREAGAEIRQVPESDKRAMAHLAKEHGVAVLMLHGTHEDYVDCSELVPIPIPGIDAYFALLRMPDRELGRAAERYWGLVLKTCSEVQGGGSGETT